MDLKILKLAFSIRLNREFMPITLVCYGRLIEHLGRCFVKAFRENTIFKLVIIVLQVHCR